MQENVEIALYNMDQGTLEYAPLRFQIKYPPYELDEAEYDIYEAGLRRGVVEALCMVLGFSHNVDEIYSGQELTIERGCYGRYNHND